MYVLIKLHHFTKLISCLSKFNLYVLYTTCFELQYGCERDWSVNHVMAANGCMPSSSQPLLSEHRTDPTIDIRGPCKLLGGVNIALTVNLAVCANACVFYV